MLGKHVGNSGYQWWGQDGIIQSNRCILNWHHDKVRYRKTSQENMLVTLGISDDVRMAYQEKSVPGLWNTQISLERTTQFDWGNPSSCDIPMLVSLSRCWLVKESMLVTLGIYYEVRMAEFSPIDKYWIDTMVGYNSGSLVSPWKHVSSSGYQWCNPSSCNITMLVSQGKHVGNSEYQWWCQDGII